jgi:hypothetical protein
MKYIKKFNENNQNFFYVLKTNEYDSKIINKTTNLDELLSNLENHILDKKGVGKIDFEFIKDRKSIDKSEIEIGKYILIVNYNGEFYNNFIIDVNNDGWNFTQDSTLY